MNEHTNREAGYSALIAVITMGLASGLAGLMSKQATLMHQVYAPIAKKSKIMDLRHYIHENFDCSNTLDTIKCNGNKFVDTYSKSGEQLTEKNGSQFGQKFTVRSKCHKNEFNFTYKTSEDSWEDLYQSLPKVCRDDLQVPCNADNVVNFETLPDGTSLSEGMAISDQYEDAYGITFSRKNGDPLYVGQVGGDHYSWGCQTCGNKTVVNGVNEDPDQPIGDYFLTDEDGYSSGDSGDLVIDYTKAVTEASAVIMDVDWDESWDIKAYDQSGKLIHSQTIKGNEYDYDGKPMLWKIDNLPPGKKIKRIVLEGTDNAGFGLGFDNFSPSQVCEEVSL